MSSSARRLVLFSTPGEDSLTWLVGQLQLLYEDRRKTLVLAGSSSQVAESSPRVRKMESKIAEKEIKRVAATTVADASSRKLDALQVRCAERDSVVMRLHGKVGAVKRLRIEVADLDRDVEKIAASLLGTTSKRDEAAKRAYRLSAQLAASLRREDSYKSELTAVKKDLLNTRVERASLQSAAKNLVSKIRHASADINGTLQAIAKSSKRMSEDVANKVKMEMVQARKRMLSSLDAAYAYAVGKIRVRVARYNDDVLWNVVCCTMLISTRHDKIDLFHLASGESGTASDEPTEPAETSGRQRLIVMGQLCGSFIFGVFLVFSLFFFLP